ncbi:MAG TPA: DUF3618 domain-containing protein [Bauldia sp.]|nr:DUF3618 domain-containing protein [Bauldia sp.]
MSLHSSLSARHLEREADDRRRQLSATLNDLADNLTPGRMLDEVIAYSRGGGASFLKGLGNAASANPLPTLLIGVGAALFLSGKGRMDSIPRGFGAIFDRSNGFRPGRDARNTKAEPQHSGNASRVGDASTTIGSAARSAASGIKEAAAAVGAAASSTTDRLSEGASNAVTAVRDTAVGVGEAVGDLAETALNAAGDEAAQLRDQALRATHEVRDRAIRLAQEQPLIVAVAGIALGAILAAALPRTKLEDELMGETSDAIKHAAGEIASQQIEKISSEADEVADEIKQTITEHGISPKAAADVVREAGERVTAALGSGAKDPSPHTGG